MYDVPCYRLIIFIDMNVLPPAFSQASRVESIYVKSSLHTSILYVLDINLDLESVHGAQ